MKLIVATSNQGKLKEIRRILQDQPIEIVGLEALNGYPELIEDGATFTENALIKARTICAFTGMPCLADDSGLVVDALDGAPGIHSARYAGEQGDDEANNRKLIEALDGVPVTQRGAAFVCVIALVWPDGVERTFEGRISGKILTEPRGDEGFGYDPLFLVPEYGRSMAELNPETKNRISHRGQALKSALSSLQR